MFQNATIASVLVLLCLCSVSAQAETELLLAGTVHVYPTEFQAHDLLYFRVELQNKSDEPVMGRRFFQDGTLRTFLMESEDYYYASHGSFRELYGSHANIEPNKSFVACNSFLEFPDRIVPRGKYSTTIARERSRQEDDEQNKKFINDYVGTEKKFKLGVALMGTGLYFSEPIIEVKSRSPKEMKAIEAWHDEFKNFLSDTSRVLEHRSNDPNFPYEWKKVPSVSDYEKLEKQLSAGTLKNYIHFRKLLASIPNSTDDATPSLVPNEHFKKLGDYLDTLHPIERRTLIDRALWYFSERSNEGKRMKYLLLPKLPRSDRARYFAATSEEEQKMFLELPEPK